MIFAATRLAFFVPARADWRRDKRSSLKRAGRRRFIRRRRQIDRARERDIFHGHYYCASLISQRANAASRGQLQQQAPPPFLLPHSRSRQKSVPVAAAAYRTALSP